jgi:hypothetical protein
MHPESDYGRMIGGSFRECLGGFAACGLLRKNFPQKQLPSIYLLTIYPLHLLDLHLGLLPYDWNVR